MTMMNAAAADDNGDTERLKSLRRQMSVWQDWSLSNLYY